ncbi:hypothetical protein ACFWOJ_36310 [Streptomyces sp. NPDC058439]|uniref:hypothetical protein n=1 Tax=Streptomyces sp. NPDC058439 TaxID=3346500 RepID=UPI00365D91CA
MGIATTASTTRRTRFGQLPRAAKSSFPFALKSPGSKTLKHKETPVVTLKAAVGSPATGSLAQAATVRCDSVKGVTTKAGGCVHPGYVPVFAMSRADPFDLECGGYAWAPAFSISCLYRALSGDMDSDEDIVCTIHGGFEPLRTRSAVLLAACVDDRAVAGHLDGPDIAAVSLGEVLTVLDRYPVSSLESCGAPVGTGGEECAELLRAFGTAEFDAIHSAVRETLKGHLADGGPHIRIADRREALRGIAP